MLKGFILQKYLNPFKQIVINGANVTQTFFVIGGFLLAYLFPSRTRNENSSVSLFIKSFILRYFRFAPMQAMIILLHSTWLYRAGFGPIFNKLVYADQQFCRQHWWKNMLFIANYSNIPEMCLVHTWYLSAEFWLNAGGILFLIIIKKWIFLRWLILQLLILINRCSKPHIKYSLLAAILSVSVFLTAFTVYVNKLEPISVFSPEWVFRKIYSQ